MQAKMPELQPQLILVGSVAEGTRLWLANEMDLMLRFNHPATMFAIRDNDPFHIFLNESTRPPSGLQPYFNSKGEFLLAYFMQDLLNSVDTAVDGLFKNEQNPPSLERLPWQPRACPACGPRLKRAKRDKRIFQHCKHCAPTVTQTKVGICLQFQWRSPADELVYCSIDIVPTYSVQPIDSFALARIVNQAMLQDVQPDGWLRYLETYAKSDLVLEHVCDFKNHSVFLKLLNSKSDDYYVRPGQMLGPEKFSSTWHANAYRNIKALKKSLGLPDLDMYMVKKLLRKPSICLMHYESVFLREFFMEMTLLPELQRHFAKRRRKSCISVDVLAAFWARVRMKKRMPRLAAMATKCSI